MGSEQRKRPKPKSTKLDNIANPARLRCEKGKEERHCSAICSERRKRPKPKSTKLENIANPARLRCEKGLQAKTAATFQTVQRLFLGQEDECKPEVEHNNSDEACAKSSRGSSMV